MIRVLQLIGMDAGFEAVREARMLRSASVEDLTIDTRTIGRGGDWRNVPCAAMALRRERAPYDLIHAWGGTALSAATWGSRLPMVFSPESEMTRQEVRRLCRAQQRRRVEVICVTEAQRRWFIEHGALAGSCRVVCPGIDMTAIREGQANSRAPGAGQASNRSASLRASLGLSENDYVLLAPGESIRSSGHMQALWATSILHVSNPRYKLLIWGRGPRAGAVRLFADHTTPEVLIVAESRLGREVEWEELPTAADAALIGAAGSGGAPAIAMCMSAGLPIVAARSELADELLADGQTALLSDPNPRALARRILDLVENPELGRKMGQNARERAEEAFSSTRHIETMRAIYKRMVL